MRRLMLVLMLVAAMLLACGGTVLAKSTHHKASQPKESTQFNDGQANQSIKLDQQFAAPESGQTSSVQKGSLAAAQDKLLNQGYLLPDPNALKKFKDAAAQGKVTQSSGESTSGESTASKSALSKSVLNNTNNALDKNDPGESTSASSASKTPTPVAGSLGLNDPKVGPSDSTSALGPDRYIETVNDEFGIYDVIGTAPTAEGSLQALFGVSANSFVTDPQMIWDPDTNRFYYAGLSLFSPTNNRLMFGFSKTDKPASAADFCHYAMPFGGTIPDYPKLGDTQNDLIIGFNSFSASSGNYLGSQLSFVQKPASGSSCPTSVVGGTTSPLSGIYTPVPANQTDGSTTGDVAATSTSLISTGSANVLPLLQLTETPEGVSLDVKNLTVPTYQVPANAQQSGSANLLDTLDGRNTQAVSAIDPSQGNKVALWTQQTIFGGGGAEVRWYEIDPNAPSVLRSEDLAVSGFYIFNAAISPDRAGSTKLFGDTMLLGANFSSTSINPGLLLEEQDGSKADGFAAPPISQTYLDDFTCHPPSGPPCRWGDYPGMSPYPATPSSFPHGLTLHTNQYVRQTGGSGSGWGSFSLLVFPS